MQTLLVHSTDFRLGSLCQQQLSENEQLTLARVLLPSDLFLLVDVALLWMSFGLVASERLRLVVGLVANGADVTSLLLNLFDGKRSDIERLRSDRGLHSRSLDGDCSLLLDGRWSGRTV